MEIQTFSFPSPYLKTVKKLRLKTTNLPGQTVTIMVITLDDVFIGPKKYNLGLSPHPCMGHFLLWLKEAYM